MRTVKLNFAKNGEGRYIADIVLPGRVNVYVNLEKPGSVKAFALVDGITEQIEIGTSDYCKHPVLDVNLIAGTQIRLQSWGEVLEAAYISEEEDV